MSLVSHSHGAAAPRQAGQATSRESSTGQPSVIDVSSGDQKALHRFDAPGSLLEKGLGFLGIGGPVGILDRFLHPHHRAVGPIREK